MRIYFDVCCLNRPFDDQMQIRIHLEAEAILSIFNYSRKAGWIVIGSDAIDYEISKMPDDDKRLMVQILSTVRDAHVRIDAVVEKRAVEIKRLGLKTLDALHVACAEKAKAEILLTTDDNFLRKAAKNKGMLRVKVENPLQWVMEVIK